MPTIFVSNLTASPFALSGGYYTAPIAPGQTVSFTVEDTDEFIGSTSIAAAIAAGRISVETSTSDASIRPIPVYTTVTLPAATAFASGTLVWDSTRMKLLASVSNVWRDQTTVIAGTTAALAALTNIPTNAIAFNTETLALQQRTAGGAWLSCSLANPAASQAGLPANPHLEGELTRNDTTQSLLVCTTAGSPGTWDSVFVAPTGAGAAPAEAATATGGAYFDTNYNRLAFRVGANWVHLPVTHYDTAANIEVLRAADGVATAGQYGWANDTNRLAVYTGAAWFNETTVGMYAGGATHAYTGAIVFDPTGFIGTMAGNGSLSVYNGAAWVPSRVVVPGYAGVPALPVVGDVPVGTLVLETTGGAGARLYAKIGAAWVTNL
jgi:hypothetical protein